MALVSATTIVGNAWVAAALRLATPRAPAHYPLASLALADCALGLTVLPLAAARELTAFQPNPIICACWSTLDVFCCTASILSLCALGWERWCGITSPLARARRLSRARLFAALVWPVSAAVALPTALVPTRHHRQGELVKACTVNTNVGYVFFSVSFSFYLPASVMIVLYSRILMALSSPPPLRSHRGRTPTVFDVESNRRTDGLPSPKQCFTPRRSPKIGSQQSPSIVGGPVFTSPNGFHLSLPTKPQPNYIPVSPPKSPATSSSIIPRQRRATRTIVALMSLFLICWAPFFIMLPIDSLCDCVSERTWQWCTWLGYANSAFNPLVYAASSPTVRRALHATLALSSSTSKTDVGMTPARAKSPDPR